MTTNGKRTLEVLTELEDAYPDEEIGFTASDITKKFKNLPTRNAPVMTVSSYLTHLKRQGLVDRQSSSDKTTAWWKTTKAGREAIRAAQA